MISLHALAQQYGVALTDADGFDLAPAELRRAVERGIRRYLGARVRTLAAFGDDAASVPAVWRGEVAAARQQIRFAELDLKALAEMRRQMEAA